ncbi:MAG: hypothetical protein L0Z53_00580 [Acidobacteriales bacterium]|nr:hypothetical protein [Terriglobales bacterium]
MESLRLFYILIGGVACASLVAGYLLSLRRKSPEQRERERRERINAIGRITDGIVLDFHEVPAKGGQSSPVQLLVFNYDVAGVTYEASQDISHLRDYVDLQNGKLGLHASIKYDPQNPGNSIVIAEGWSGLRLSEQAQAGIARHAMSSNPEA